MFQRDRFLTNLGWKFFSLVLAVAVWFIVSYKSPDESFAGARSENLYTNIYSDLPVMTMGLLPGARAQIYPAAVTAVVVGPRGKMATLQRNEIIPQVNLSGVVSGSDLLRSVAVALPPGLTYTVDPPEVSVTVAPPSSKPSPNPP